MKVHDEHCVCRDQVDATGCITYLTCQSPCQLKSRQQIGKAGIGKPGQARRQNISQSPNMSLEEAGQNAVEDSAFEKWGRIYFSIDKELCNFMTAKRLSCSLVSAQITRLGRRHFLPHLRKSHICLQYSLPLVRLLEMTSNNSIASLSSCHKVALVFVKLSKDRLFRFFLLVVGCCRC